MKFSIYHLILLTAFLAICTAVGKLIGLDAFFGTVVVASSFAPAWAFVGVCTPDQLAYSSRAWILACCLAITLLVFLGTCTTRLDLAQTAFAGVLLSIFWVGQALLLGAVFGLWYWGMRSAELPSARQDRTTTGEAD